jgi:hypothetical protein
VQALPGWLRRGKTNTESPSPPSPLPPLLLSTQPLDQNPIWPLLLLSSSAAAAQEVMYLRLGQICGTGSDVDGRSRGLTVHSRWGRGSSGGRRGGASCGHGAPVGTAAAGLLCGASGAPGRAWVFFAENKCVGIFRWRASLVALGPLSRSRAAQNEFG